jgi:hypothetical protein
MLVLPAEEMAEDGGRGALRRQQVEPTPQKSSRSGCAVPMRPTIHATVPNLLSRQNPDMSFLLTLDITRRRRV